MEDDLPSFDVNKKRDVEYGSLAGMAGEIAGDVQGAVVVSGEVAEMSGAARAMLAERQAAENVITSDRMQRDVEGYLPVLDPDVRIRLRSLREPITLFGEGPYDRRMRLRALLASMMAEGKRLDLITAPTAPAAQQKQQERFYTEGGTALQQARLDIAEWSLPRAKERVRMQQEAFTAASHVSEEDAAAERASFKASLKKFQNLASGVPKGGSVRPLSQCRISPSGEYTLLSSWNEALYLYKVPEMSAAGEDTSGYKSVFGGHKNRVTGCAFHPESTVAQDPNAANFCSSSADKTVRVWSLTKDTPLATMEGHTDKVNKVAFHPTGNYVGSTSDDKTFRLWDVHGGRQATSLMEQEGHAACVYGMSFQCDGSIVATSDTWGVVRVWDLRTGRSLFVLEGHAKEVTALSFSPNGWLLCTGGADNLLKVWDLRRREPLVTLPAHSRLITSVAFEPTNGSVLAASSHDTLISLYETTNFKVWSMEWRRGRRRRVKKIRNARVM